MLKLYFAESLQLYFWPYIVLLEMSDMHNCYSLQSSLFLLYRNTKGAKCLTVAMNYELVLFIS
jgi:hypothetical protein